VKGGFYDRYLLPRLLEWALGSPACQREREITLALSRGKTLEIGFGTGLNLPHYPSSVTDLTVVDSVEMPGKKIEARIGAAAFPVHRTTLDASSRLPADDCSFDSIVTTWTLCSIGNLEAALSEIRRVLKPDGIYLFLEHGRSDDPRIARRQDFINPLHRCLGRGCNINRKIDRFLQEAGLVIETMDRFILPFAPRVSGEMYRGTARRNEI